MIARCVRPDSNCVDIGAHIGSTLSTLVRLAPHGQHFAFEPIQEKASWIDGALPPHCVFQVDGGTEAPALRVPVPPL